MKYCMLLWPHANVRYQNETVRLATGELRLMLNAFDVQADISVYDALSIPALKLDTEKEIEGGLLNAVRMHSLLYGLFEIADNGALLPVAGRREPCIGSDLPGILKYKGKTNELFLQLLINAALYSGSYARRGESRLELLDPMCGRATTLFVGANFGWNTTGTDLDRADLAEAEKFLKRYFEYHRMKHSFRHTSRTAGGKAVPLAEFGFADTPENFKKGDLCTLNLANGDAVKIRDIFGREKFHMIVCDLPYGVQHGALGGSPEQLLQRALPGWREALKKGGTVAVSYNANTLKTETVHRLMEKAGLEPMTGGAYDGFEHWVEQAVTRDLAVGRRNG